MPVPVAPPGEALPDWQIARNFALRLAPALGRRDGSKLFPYFHAEQVFLEVRNYVRKQAGRVEILRLPSFERPEVPHLSRATERLDFLRKIGYKR